MLIEFSFSNFRSVNKMQSISFRASGLISDDKNVDMTNIVNVEGNNLLKTIGIYGANASGKSNVLKALNLLRRMVGSSLVDEGLSKNLVNPFKLTTEKRQIPLLLSSFSVKMRMMNPLISELSMLKEN